MTSKTTGLPASEAIFWNAAKRAITVSPAAPIAKPLVIAFAVFPAE